MKRLLWIVGLLSCVSASALAQAPARDAPPATSDAPTEVEASPHEAVDAQANEAPTNEAERVDDAAPAIEATPTIQVVDALATEAAEPPVDALDVPEPTWADSVLSKFRVHGFVSEGAFVSTANDYIGKSSRGSLKFLEVGINVSTELSEQLRVGVQFVARNVGTLSEDVPRLDWGLADYRFAQGFGLRLGVIKVPLGLHNEYAAIDAARTSILLPQSLYPLRNRDALISHTGFAAYGTIPLGGLGELEYQAWLGTLTIPRSALVLDGASLDAVDAHYVTGAQLFLRPIDGLRLGVTYLRAAIDFHITIGAGGTQELIGAGLVPPDYDGSLILSQNPTGFWVGSAEYIYEDWTFTAEYGRWLKHQVSTLPLVFTTINEDSERFYAMVTYRVSPHLDLGTYYSVLHADAGDRSGSNTPFSPKWTAFQRDLALSMRFDINDYWLLKIEGHLIDGVADLDATRNLTPTRTWGMFLMRTTVTF